MECPLERKSGELIGSCLKWNQGGNYMAKKRKAKKGKIKRRRTAKKNNPKKRSSRKPVLRAVATSGKEDAVRQARTPHDIFEGINGRRPKSDQELNEWLASPEGQAAMAFEPTSLSRWGETGRS
jgi:hypothetical protein